METVKVVIVGGGAAGLAAAKTLGTQVDYLLLEAQDYLGGRIRTVDAGSSFASSSQMILSLVSLFYVALVHHDDQLQMSLSTW